MSIKITCPHCKRGMLVPEHLAGKKGRCKACQQILTVPALPGGSAKADSPAKAAAPPHVDVDAEAAALFADEPKPVEQPVESKTIDLDCPFCAEPIHLAADLAGKRAPCPECKHIIKVPELVKKDPKDWRKVEARGPSGARTDEPVLEGAWGSTRAAAVGKQTLVQAGVIPVTQPPRTTWQKVRWPVLGVGLVLVLSIGGWTGYRWWGQRAIGRALDEALAYAASPDAKPLEQAGLNLGSGAYYRRTHSDKPAEKANNQLGKAFNTLRSASKSDDRDALLGELALAYLDLAGDKAAVDQYLAQPWDKTQQLLEAVLREIKDGDARLQAFREVVARLLARGQSERILPLTNRLSSANEGDKAAALAVVAFEFLKAKDQAKADRAANDAIALYDSKTPPPLRAEAVALAETLKKKVPQAGEEQVDKDNAHIGKIEGLARRGERDEARKLAEKEDFAEEVRFRARLALAAAAVDAQVADTADVENALKMAEGALGGKPELSWPLYRLTLLALNAHVPEERVQALADKIGNSGVRGFAQLAVFRARLEKSKQAVDDAAIDKIEEKSVARSLAAQALVRHNTRYGANYSTIVQGWPQPRKAFGSLGVALGLQDREK
jgi:hypothetical protein